MSGRRRGNQLDLFQEAYATTQSAGAPARERVDAQAALTKAFWPGANGFALIEDVGGAINAIEEMNRSGSGGMFEEVGAFLKAWQLPYSTPVVPPNSLGMRDMKREEGEGPKSIMVDELGNFSGYYREKPSAYGFDDLRALVEACVMLNAIILTRARQVGRFCRLAERDRPLGFEIRRRRHAEVVETEDERKRREWLEDFFLNCGDVFDPIDRQQLGRDDLTAFLMKATRDTYTLDALSIETERTRNGRNVSGFYCVDGATIRIVGESEQNKGVGRVTNIQVVSGIPVQTYTAREMIYRPRNPRTDVRQGGYGYSEGEMFVRLVTGFLNAVTYNLKGFDANAVPKGLLSLFGDFDQQQLNYFKQQWNAMVRGVNNRWALPVLVSRTKEGAAQFQTLGKDFDEMHFAKWMTFIASCACSCYGMDPTEINFESFSAKSSSSMSGSDTAERLANARDKGLEPLLAYFESLFTDFILSQFYDRRYAFRFLGLKPEEDTWKHEVQKTTLTVNEMRRREGIPELTGADLPLGDAPVNPTLMQVYTLMLQQQGGQGAAGMPGMPGFDDGSGVGGAGGAPVGGVPGATGIGPQGPTPEQAEGSDYGAKNRGDGTGPGARRTELQPGAERIDEARRVISGEKVGKSVIAAGAMAAGGGVGGMGGAGGGARTYEVVVVE